MKKNDHPFDGFWKIIFSTRMDIQIILPLVISKNLKFFQNSVWIQVMKVTRPNKLFKDYQNEATKQNKKTMLEIDHQIFTRDLFFKVILKVSKFEYVYNLSFPELMKNEKMKTLQVRISFIKPFESYDTFCLQ